MKAITNVSVAPVRADQSDRAEMVSQLLYGESVSILETQNNWIKIETDFDQYTGWVDYKQITPISDKDFSKRKTKILQKKIICLKEENSETLLSIGSEVEDFNDELSFSSDENIEQTALKFLNVPYLWGGRSIFGIDCSGFTQIVYKINGIKLPRDAYQQAKLGDVLDFIEEAQCGDLAFFENKEGKIIHVGIMLDEQKIIHAHGKVRIDSLDSVGIFNKELNKHTHILRFIKRIKNFS